MAITAIWQNAQMACDNCSLRVTRPFPLAASLALLAAITASSPANADPDALRRLVLDHCVPAALAHHHPPRPCTEVSAPAGQLRRGYAVLKDLRGRYQYLVLPLIGITGIESPALLRAHAPNYLADAWTARLYVEAALHTTVPRRDLSLAVNSRYGRTQNLLHIHVDCIRADVQNSLRRMRPAIGTQWKPLPEPLLGYRYEARWVNGATLRINPFASLAHTLPAGTGLGHYGLAVVGARSPDGQPGFIVLATRTSMATGNRGSVESLQDRSCSVVRHRSGS